MSSRLAVLPVTADLSSVRGAAFSVTITMQWESTQNKVDFGSWSIEALMINGSAESPYTVTIIEPGVITVSMTGSQTAAVSAGAHKWWIAVTFPTGFKRTIVRGTHTLS